MIGTDAPTPCAAQPEQFDDDHGARDDARVKWLQKLCGGCPLLDACRVYAVATHADVAAGFMAGMTERERRAAHKRAAVAREGAAA